MTTINYYCYYSSYYPPHIDLPASYGHHSLLGTYPIYCLSFVFLLIVDGGGGWPLSCVVSSSSITNNRVLHWGIYSIDWGGTYFFDSDEALLSLFDDLERAIDRPIDRWHLDVTPGTSIPSIERYKQPVKYMINYFSIGIDGRVSSRRRWRRGQRRRSCSCSSRSSSSSSSRSAEGAMTTP